jgi:hypothetical protein
MAFPVSVIAFTIARVSLIAGPGLYNRQQKLLYGWGTHNEQMQLQKFNLNFTSI